MERVFWSLKYEWTDHESFADETDAQLSVLKYIETFYNPVRLHQTIGYHPQSIRSRPRPGICGEKKRPAPIRTSSASAQYIKTFHNLTRLHQTLGCQSFKHFEAVHAPALAA
jgi:hypothetical protein